MTTTASYTTNTGNALDELCYQYKYDKRNRLIEKKIPGKGWDYIVYDKLDRSILTQDANQRLAKQWLFSKYDAFGRVVYTGIYTNISDTSRIQLQNLADTELSYHFENKQVNALNLNGTTVYYSNRSFPTNTRGSFSINTINYYDDYLFDTENLLTAVAVYGITPTTQTKGLATGSKVRVLETSDWISSITQYDSKARPIYIATKNNYLSTTDIVKRNLDFVGKLTETTSTHTKIGQNTITMVDAFTYDAQGRLLKQTQTINSGTTEVIAENTYDVNGNLKTDANKNITAIQYNYLNLPTQVSFGATKNINYIYDASGTKLKKVVNDNGMITTTDYAGNFIYENNVLQFFNTAEGYVEPINASDYNQGFSYVYQFKDHLGNVRLSYSDSDGNGSINPLTEIIEEKNYYPLGLTHKGYNNIVNGTAHPYGFNGKEENQELGLDWLDFSARNYDPALGRWMNIDPLAEQMRRHSPYNYAFNNPLRFIDPDGMAPDDVIIKGEKADEAFKQLKASTSLRLKMDDNGKVTAKGKAKTDADKTLLEAINSETVEVSINATDSNFTDSGNWFVGGAFGGSEVNEDGKTVANQTVNPEQTETIDEFYGVQNGVSVLHEVLEAYVGGKDSPGTGVPTFDDVKNKTSNGTNYLNAHNKVEALDPRHVAPTISQDPKTGQLYINKPHPVIPQLNTEKLINNLSKKKN